MPMTGFFCQDEYLAKTSKLTDEEFGRLFRALMNYHANGCIADLDGRESIAFDFIKEDIDKAEEAYQKKCKQASDNRRKGLNQESTDDNAGKRPSTSVNGSDHNNINININRNINKNNKKIEKEQKQVLFDRFWSEYPRHEGKQNAVKAFEKLNADEALLETMIAAIRKQKQSAQWQENGGQFIPHPATWLNGHRWEDEVTPVQKKPVVVAQQYEQRDYTGVQDQILDAYAREIEERLRQKGVS